MHRSAGRSAYDGVIFNVDPMQIDKISADFPPMWSRHRGSGDRWHAAHSCTPPAPSGDSNSETRGNPSQSVPLSHDFRTRVASPMSASYREIAISKVEYRTGRTNNFRAASTIPARNLSRESGMDRPSPAARAVLWRGSGGRAERNPHRTPHFRSCITHTFSRAESDNIFGQLAKLWSPPKPEPEGGGGHLVNSNRWHPLA
jgi:hypothetical protein